MFYYFRTNYTECYKNCQNFVKKYKVTVARDLDKRDIFATSYFYELARQAGMISKDAVQGKFNLTSIEEYAKEGNHKNMPINIICYAFTLGLKFSRVLSIQFHAKF